ncbi:uncharacterized protein METZ01_LOCUS503676, partial [marine metagenome]
MSDITFCDFDGVRVLTIARPRRSNALACATIRELSDALSDAEAAESINAVVISGKEDRFSGGADLDDLNGTIDDLLFDDELGLLTEQIQKSSLRSAAAVEGV